MKAKVIMLETTKEANSNSIILRECDNKLIFNTPKIFFHGKVIEFYLIDESAEIIEGDWCLCDDRMNIYELHQFFVGRCKSIENGWINVIDGQGENPDWTHKIIASTDKSLTSLFGGQEVLDFPYILSEQSIKLLIDYYNKNGKMPDEVEVETKMKPHIGEILDDSYPDFVIDEFNTIKLNSEGTVDITILEENMYSREEIISIIKNCCEACDSEGGLRWDELDEWISKNLK